MSYPETHNFMIADLLASAAACIAFPLVLFLPGYVVGWTTRLFSFRSRSASERILLSIVLSVAVAPILAVLVARFLSITGLEVCFGLLAVAGVFLIAAEGVRNSAIENFKPSRSTCLALGMAAVWTGIALFELADLQIGQRLYLSVTAFDHCLRTEVVQAVLRTGVPPHNPLFYASGQAPVMRYYYYWYVLCAVPSKLLGLSARASLTASSVWCGFALASLIPLYLKYFFHESIGLRMKSLIGIALLGVTGLDLIPNLIWFAKYRIVFADTDWWNPNQVASWLASLLLVPHHVAALVACLTGFLVLSHLADGMSLRDGVSAALIAGAAFASAAGLSVYVTLTFILFVVVWTFYLLLTRHYAASLTYAASGVVSLLLSLPYLHDLRGIGGGTGGGGGGGSVGLVYFAVRDFQTLLYVLHRYHVTDPLLLNLATIAALPLVYAVEFGFFLFVGVLWFKKVLRGSSRLSANQLAAWFMLGVSFFVATFLRSGVIANNDLGMRSPLPAQFILLLWASPLLVDLFSKADSRSDTRSRILRIAAICLLAFGVLGSVNEALIVRMYAPLTDSGTIRRTEEFMPAGPQMGQRTYALRTGYEQLNAMLPQRAIVQHNPSARSFLPLLLYSNHQAVAGDEACGAVFGGDPHQCELVVRAISPLFAAPDMIGGWNIDALCSELSIDVLVVTDQDRAWYDPNSWVWTRKAMVANPYMRAIACGR